MGHVFLFARLVLLLMAAVALCSAADGSLPLLGAMCVPKALRAMLKIYPSSKMDLAKNPVICILLGIA